MTLREEFLRQLRLRFNDRVTIAEALDVLPDVVEAWLIDRFGGHVNEEKNQHESA